MKSVGMFAQGIAAYDSGKYTRKVMQTNAQNRQNAGVMERDRIREAARMAIGSQLVQHGGSGFQMGTGSALDELHQSAINRELDFALSRSKASNEAAGFKQQGDIAYAQGKSAMAGGIISGVVQLASDIASAAAGGMPGGMPGGGGGSMSIKGPDLSSTQSVSLGSSSSMIASRAPTSFYG